jgi:Flp pilus assembly protein TadD
VAAFTALLFGIHPTRHEVVAWVSSNSELLCAVLFLSAFLAYLNWRERRSITWMCASCLLYGAALLSKETAVVLPGLVGIHSFLYADGDAGSDVGRLSSRVGRAMARASVYAPIAILYAVLRIHMLHGFSHPVTSLRLSAVLLTLPSVAAFYLKQWIFPVHMLLFYDLFPRTDWSFRHVLLPAIAVLAVVAALYYWGRRHSGRELAFAMAAALLPLLPVLYISIFPASELVHDRYAYLPGFGMSFVTALICSRFFKGPLVFGLPRGLALLSALLIVPLAYSTASASSYWFDNYTLFEHASRMAPLNVTAKNNYAVAIASDGQQGDAMAIFQEILREHPNNFLANYNLGRLFYEVNLLDPAEHYLQAAQRLDPTRPDPYLQLGLVYVKAGVMDKAVANFSQAAVLTPNNSKVHFAYGVALAQREDCTGARAQFGEALSLNPNFVKAREQMDKCGKASSEAPATSGVAEPARPASAASTVVARPKLASASGTLSHPARP